MKKMRRTLLFITILLLALVAAPGVSAAPQKKGSATLSGVVLGPDDRPVAHASVSYQSSGGMGPHAVHTDSHGHFTISKLRTDNYDLRASGKGVFSDWQKNVSLRTGETKNLTLRLIYAKEIPKAYVKSKPKQ
jgi:carboxypeptidase family protein